MPSGTRLINALATGALVSSASKQLSRLDGQPLTLAGANSITTTLLQEAKVDGDSRQAHSPAQLVKGTAG